MTVSMCQISFGFVARMPFVGLTGWTRRRGLRHPRAVDTADDLLVAHLDRRDHAVEETHVAHVDRRVEKRSHSGAVGWV